MSKLPDGWDALPLGEFVASFKNGYSRRPKAIEEGPIVLRLADVTKGYIDLSDIRRVAMSSEEFATYKLRKDDILITRVNGSRDYVGQCIWVDRDYDKLAYNDHLIRIRLKEGLDSHFLQYAFSDETIRNRLLAFVPLASGGQLTINQTSLENVVIPVPSLPEQRVIAAILSTWDEAITLTEALIKALQHRKQALMQLLLTGDRRKNWEVMPLNEVAEILLSNVDKKIEQGELDVLLCNYMDVYRNNYITKDISFMEASATPAEIRKFKLKKGDVIITKDSETAEDIAQAAVVTEELDNVVCGYHLAIIRPFEDKAIGQFLRELLLVPDVHHQFIKAANGVTRYGLTSDGIASIEIPIPPSLKDQQNIADILSVCDEWVQGLVQYCGHLQTQKRALMQKLLTGAIRVPGQE